MMRPDPPGSIAIRHVDGSLVSKVRVGSQGKSVASILDALRVEGFDGVLKVGEFTLTREDTVLAGDDVRLIVGPEPPRLRVRARSFLSGLAIDLSAHYYVPWPDLGKLVHDLKSGRWLLLTAPWQSGKTTLLQALAAELEKDRAFLVLFTTLRSDMIMAGNNRDKSELEAAHDFFDLVKTEISKASRGRLEMVAGRSGVSSMFEQGGGKPIIWLVDEAQLLNELYHTTGLARRILFEELRLCKQQCRPRDPNGRYWLCSFSLCGLPFLSGLIGDLRDQRMMAARQDGGEYHNPRRPTPLPLSVEVWKDDWNLTAEQIGQMLREYAQDRHICFCMEQGSHDEALMSIASDIFARTSGHKGMVGCCCELLERRQVTSWEGWLKLVRCGTVSSYTFTSRCYSQLIRNVARYVPELQEVLVECIKSADGSTRVDKMDSVLEALDDGVLVQSDKDLLSVCFSSGLLLETLLESCAVAPMAAMPPPTDSLLVAFEAAFTLMDHSCFLRPEGLSSTGQPSEYVMQSQLLLALKFVMTKGIYTGCGYKVLVEVKQRDEKGQRRMRMDLFLENDSSRVEGIEVEVGGNAASIQEHVKRSDYYGALHECKMHYVYFCVGEEDTTGAKREIMAQASNFPAVTCWYVRFSQNRVAWDIERVETEKEETEETETKVKQRFWHSVQKPSAPQFPQILLETAEPLRKKHKI